MLLILNIKQVVSLDNKNHILYLIIRWHSIVGNSVVGYSVAAHLRESRAVSNIKDAHLRESRAVSDIKDAHLRESRAV